MYIAKNIAMQIFAPTKRKPLSRSFYICSTLKVSTKPFYKATEMCRTRVGWGAMLKVKSSLALSALRTWRGALIKLEARMGDI